MEYSVTIKNDSRFSNGDGIVHTWLEFNATGEDTQYFGFSPQQDSVSNISPLPTAPLGSQRIFLTTLKMVSSFR